MAAGPSSPLIRYIRRIAGQHLAAELSDSDLLDRFGHLRDEAAFAVLVRRHSPLVLATCQRVVHDWHTAEDCSQAVFLVLAKKARSLRRSKSLGPWLHAVATRVALKARGKASRRWLLERKAAVSAAVKGPDYLVWTDLRPVLDDAVAHLTEKYRVPFVLCYLQGRTVAEIARQLNHPKGTVAARLARAREQLRGRLARRGLALSMAALTVALSENAAPASVLPPFIAGTVKAAGVLAAGKEAALAVIPARVAILMEGVLRSMLLAKLKVSMGVLVAVAGIGLLGYHGAMARGEGQGTGKEKTREQAKKLPTAMPAAERRMYELHFKVTEVDAQGKERILSTPAMRAAAGVESTLRLGTGELTVAGKPFSWGLSLSATVTPRQDGLLRLEMRFEREEPIPSRGRSTLKADAEKTGRLMISGQSFRFVKVVSADTGERETISMPLQPDEHKEQREIRVEIDEIKQFKLVEVPVISDGVQVTPVPPALPANISFWIGSFR